MEISQTKMSNIKKVISIFMIMIMGVLLYGDAVIAQGKEYSMIASNKASLMNEVATVKTEVKIVKKEQIIVDYKMPLYTDISPNLIKIWGTKVKGTDKWNNLIKKVSQEEGIDPIFVKCIMAIESSGKQSVINKNKNLTTDYGLMQVNTCWKSRFDYKRMLKDPEYAIRSGVKIIKYKIKDAVDNGNKPTVFEILWRYNGKSKKSNKGKNYALRLSKLYEDLSGKDMNQSVIYKEIKKIV